MIMKEECDWRSETRGGAWHEDKGKNKTRCKKKCDRVLKSRQMVGGKRHKVQLIWIYDPTHGESAESRAGMCE